MKFTLDYYVLYRVCACTVLLGLLYYYFDVSQILYAKCLGSCFNEYLLAGSQWST